MATCKIMFMGEWYNQAYQCKYTIYILRTTDIKFSKSWRGPKLITEIKTQHGVFFPITMSHYQVEVAHALKTKHE